MAFIMLFLVNDINAQTEYEDDAAVWINIYLEKKINKNWDIHLNQQNRFNENVKNYGMGYADFGLTYSFNKNVKILGDYVFVQRRVLDGTYSTRHQFYTALVLKKELRKWSFIYRNMLQIQVKDVYTSEDGAVPEYYERNKLTIKYKMNKYFTFYTAEELYLPFYQVRNKGLDRSRTFVGFFYNLSKHTNIELYMLYQHQLNAFNATNRDYIYGLGFSQEF